MSIQAKQLFTEEVQEKLEDDLTVKSMRRVTEAITDTLEGYDMEPVSGRPSSETNDLIKIFASAKSVEGRSPRTINRYLYVVDRFLAFAQVPVGKVTINHIRDYFAEEKARGVSDRTIEGYRSTLSSIFGWLYKEELIKRNPCANLGSVKYQKKVMFPFSATDIERMKENCLCDRDKALVCFLASTGARISEVCALNRNSVDLRNRECLVLGKGNKERTVYIDTVAAMVLHRYLSSRSDDSDALFVGRDSKRLTPGGVRKMLKRLETVSGVENIHPHRFRRTLATNLIRHGMPILEVSQILGHAKLDVTMTYIYTEQEDVKNNYQKFI